VVVVFVVDCELTKLFTFEFTPAARTDPGKNLERLLPITLLTLPAAVPGISYNLIHFVFV
jgi:hypothetical protein